MNSVAQRIVDQLLEGLPAPSEATLDEIMLIVIQTAKALDTQDIKARIDQLHQNMRNLPNYSPAYKEKAALVSQLYNETKTRFEQEVNPKLAKYSVKFDWAAPGFVKVRGAQGYAVRSGAVINTPDHYKLLDAYYQNRLRTAIGHELVHFEQKRRAQAAGSPPRMGKKAYDINNTRSYHRDPHEIMAHAHSAVQMLPRKRARALNMLRKPSDADHAYYLKGEDEKGRNRFLKRAYGYASQLPETMSTATRIVNTLLETLPGRSQEEVDEIMRIIMGVVDRVKSGNPRVDIPRFETEVNPLLAKYGITFDSENEVLKAYGAPGYTDLEGVVMMTPHKISRDGFSHVRDVLSHELVHGDQIGRAMLTGNAAEMVGSAKRRMQSSGGGELDMQQYKKDPHEITAYARSVIDRMRNQKATRSSALQSLRTQPLGRYNKTTEPKEHNRFLKHAAGYAQQLPEP